MKPLVVAYFRCGVKQRHYRYSVLGIRWSVFNGEGRIANSQEKAEVGKLKRWSVIGFRWSVFNGEGKKIDVECLTFAI